MTLSLEQAFRFAWDRYKSNLLLWVLLSIPSVVSVIADRFIPPGKNPWIVLAAVRVPLGLIATLFGLLMAALALKALEKETVNFDDLAGHGGRFASGFLAYLLVGAVMLVIVLGPSLLVLKTGLYMGRSMGAVVLFVGLLAVAVLFCLYLLIRFYFFNYLILDGRTSALDSFPESSRLTAGVRLWIFLFLLIMAILNFPAKFVFGLSQLITVPLGVLAGASLYRQVLTQKETP
jgi:hypothetical protein